jgi:Cdc6-like AAA superfamily ATPase
MATAGEGFKSTVTEPQNEADWFSLDISAGSIFSPHKPIDEQDLFAGRIPIVKRLIDVVFQEGEHAILYGARGVGKSSLANIIKDKVLSTGEHFHVIKRNCTSKHDFKLIWQHVFDQYEFGGESASEWIGKNNNPYDIYRVVQSFRPSQRLVIIIDEFDRVGDEKTKVMMADTIKYLSDYGSHATIIVVGVAESVSDLFKGHASIARNIDQIGMPMMNPQELRQIIETRLRLLSMTAEDSVISAIVALSQGLPGYTHLMGQAAARYSISRKMMNIDAESLGFAVNAAIERADESITSAYLKAIRSSKPGNLYKEVLLACALTKIDERGYFNAASVKVPYSEIVRRDTNVPDFSRHLGEFTKTEKGPALVKEGKPRSYQYRFAEPLLRPYTIVRGVRDGLISADTIQ